MSSVFDPNVAIYLAQATPLAKRILARVAALSTVSGWALSSMLDADPEEIKIALDELRAQELLGADGEGLEGIYYLTQVGYLSWDLIEHK